MATLGTWTIFSLFSFTVLLSGTLTFAGPSLIVSHSPEYVRFKKEAGRIAASEIDKLISSTFGHSLKQDLKWSGLEQGSLFHRPKANVLFTLEGVRDVDVNHIAKFPVDTDEIVVNTPRVANRIEDRPQGEKSFIVDFSENSVYDVRTRHPKLLSSLPTTLADIRDHVTGDNSLFTELGVGALNMSHDQDAAFLGELQVIHEVISALQADQSAVKDNIPDLFHFRLMAMNRLVQHYGAGSQPVLDAQRLLNTLLNKLTQRFRDLYSNHVVVEILTLPGVDSTAHIRKTRSLLADPVPVSLSKQLGVSDEYREFAAIFNIILWTLIILALVVIAVSYAMWTMDPGRDSIIYRMTTQRMKKD